MKKQFLFAMAAVAMLASCSNDDVVSNNGIDGDKSPLEVKLGQPSIISSRASISTTTGWNNNSQIGIFALNRVAPDWTVTTDPNDRLIYNVTASVDATGANLSWTKPVYYPYLNKYQYSFYGYHPVQTADKIVATTSVVTCDFTLDGTQDIMWGKAVLPTTTDGYNYKYMTTGTPATPKIQFEHLLTRFQFFVTGTVGAIAKNLAVTKVEILNVQTAAKLIIADKADTEIAATRTLALTGATKTLVLKDAGGADATKVKATNGAGTAMGESIMLPAGATSYDVQITFQDFDQATTAITIPAKLTKTGGGAFVAGQSHKVTITLTEPKKVDLTTALTDWTESEEIPL